MRARGKREARRPWFMQNASFRPEGPKYVQHYYALFRAGAFDCCIPGATRFALAPGFHIPRLWRCIYFMTEDFYCDEVLSGRTAVRIVRETDNVLAYHHTRPFWPVHIVIIPKRHISSLLALEESDDQLLLELMAVVREVAKRVLEEHGACRVLTNLGKYQDSKHLHWHVSSGEPRR